MVTATRRTVNHTNGANVDTNQKKKWCRVELRQWMCRISDMKKKRLQQKMLEYVLARSWREECSCHSGSHGHSGSSREASAWTDRSHTTVFRFLGDGGDLVVESPFECAKQLPRRKAEVSALTLQPQVLLSKASPRCHSLAGGRREVKWESSCSLTTTTTTTSSVRAAGRGLGAEGDRVSRES